MPPTHTTLIDRSPAYAAAWAEVLRINRTRGATTQEIDAAWQHCQAVRDAELAKEQATAEQWL